MKSLRISVIIILTSVFLSFTNGKLSNERNCIPAADFITEKFDTYNIICIDEGPHSTLQTHSLLRKLFESENFLNTVQYVILEFANSDYQNILDSYVAGEDVNPDELKLLWRESTQAHSENFDKPVYLKLLETLRSANQKLSIDKKIRVIAGDPHINWNSINTINEYFSAISQRDILPSELAITYGIDSSKNVLLIYGGEHLSKLSDIKKDSTFWTIPFYINKKYPGSVFSIGAFVSANYPSIKIDCPVNSIVSLIDDSLGFLPVKENSGQGLVKLNDVFDAVYYAGPSEGWRQDTAPKIDSVYWEELNRRSKIIWGEGIDSKLRIGN